MYTNAAPLEPAADVLGFESALLTVTGNLLPQRQLGK
jgi:hypothetical protein